MVAFAYAIPVIASLLLHFEFRYSGSWYAYMWVIVFGEATVGLLHWLFYKYYTSRTEYLGSIVTDIVYEEDWTELVEVRETKRDSRGNSYEVIRFEEKYHDEKYYFHTTRGSEIKTGYGFFSYVRDLWQLPGSQLTWSGRHIKGGKRFGSIYEFSEFERGDQDNPKNWVSITEPHSYTNKIQASNSIFKFERIDKKEAAEMGLLDYPAVYAHDAPCVLSNDIVVPKHIDELFRKFNARYAPPLQMRLYVLLFDSGRGISISERQREYWQGGNKNEFVVCIGMKAGREVEWARAFSWADEQSKEVETAQWLMNHPKMDWTAFHNWLREHVRGWKRKEFKDFDYISITLPLWQSLCILAGAVVENALVLYIAL